MKPLEFTSPSRLQEKWHIYMDLLDPVDVTIEQRTLANSVTRGAFQGTEMHRAGLMPPMKPLKMGGLALE